MISSRPTKYRIFDDQIAVYFPYDLTKFSWKDICSEHGQLYQPVSVNKKYRFFASPFPIEIRHDSTIFLDYPMRI